MIRLERHRPHPGSVAIGRDLGWVEGDNLSLEIRYPTAGAEQLPDIAPALQASGVDVIMASGR